MGENKTYLATAVSEQAVNAKQMRNATHHRIGDGREKHHIHESRELQEKFIKES
jgi:hypothetical protein